MLEQQSFDQLRPMVGVDQRLPFSDASCTVQRRHIVEKGEEPRHVFQEVLVLVEQKMAAHLNRCLDDGHLRCPDCLDQCAGDLALTDLAAFGFDEDRLPGRKAAQPFPEHGFESLLTGLRFGGQAAEQRSSMAGKLFEIEHLTAFQPDLLKQTALGAAGSATHHDQSQGLGQGFELGDHMAPEGAVSALDHRCSPTDASHDRGQ